MITGHFMPLASVDDHRTITICRHGVIHLNWWNLTLRFLPDRFAQIVDVLDHGDQMLVSLGPWCDDDVCLETRDGRHYALTIGPVRLVLEAQEYRELTEMAHEAQERLESVLDSGWLEEPEEEEPFNILETLTEMPFSQN